MINEIILGFIALIEIIFILRLSKLSCEWFYGFTVVNLLLIAILGGKLISVFGLTTNTGNIFYVSVYLATYMIIEYCGVSMAYRSVWIGAISVFFFTIMAQLVISMQATTEARNIDSAMNLVFQQSIRVSLASIFAFVIAQGANIWLYQKLRERTKTKLFWLRVAASNMVAQAVDSVLFFTIAFVEVIPSASLSSAIFTSYAIKVLFGLSAIPFLYSRLPKRAELQK